MTSIVTCIFQCFFGGGTPDSNIFSLYPTPLPVVRFGFSQSVYPVPEEDASGEGYILEVCVELFSGELDREVVIRVEGQDGSAIGKQYNIISTVVLLLNIIIE